METNSLDLSDWVVAWTKTGPQITYQLRVSKKVYDEIRMDRGGKVILDGKEWKIMAFETEYIGIGEDFFLDIALVVEKTISTIRDEKLNKLV